MTRDTFNSSSDPAQLGRALFDAISRNDLPEVDRLCYKESAPLDYRDAEGRVAHVFAASIGHTGLMHYLLQSGTDLPTRGMDVNSRDHKGMTALMHCMARGDEEGGKILLHHFKARVTPKNKEGQTARRLAELSGKNAFAAVLKRFERSEKFSGPRIG